MADFEGIANLFAIQNFEEQENVARVGRLNTNDNHVDPLSD